MLHSMIYRTYAEIFLKNFHFLIDSHFDLTGFSTKKLKNNKTINCVT